MAQDNYTHTKRSRKKGGLAIYGYNNGKKKDKPSEAGTENLSGKMQVEVKGAGDVRFNFIAINGFTLIDKEYKTPSKRSREMTREDFKKNVRPAFLKYIAEHHEPQLRKLGVSDAGLERMKKGLGLNGYNVHHKLPIHGGGTNDFSNLIFMPIPPHDELHNKVINPQIKNFDTRMGVVIKLPWRDGMVWERPLNSREKAQSKPTMMVARMKQKAAER
ncbi:putative uncharacterized protein [Acetobacter sp. CAG:977]|nr:putative uncharacterized protein [Acetobacter sp. CAG:977]